MNAQELIWMLQAIQHPKSNVYMKGESEWLRPVSLEVVNGNMIVSVTACMGPVDAEALEGVNA